MTVHRLVFTAFCLVWLAGIARADTPPAATATAAAPEPTPDTPKGAVKLFCHRLIAGEVDKALELCPADTTDEDKELLKSAVDCFLAYENLRKAVVARFEANEAIPESFSLYGPKPPTDSYVTSAKESPDADDANRVELKMSSTMAPIVVVKQGDAWRVLPRDLLRTASPNRDDPGEFFKTFTEHAKQITQDLADGKYESAKDVQRETSRRRSEYSRAQYEKRRKGGL